MALIKCPECGKEISETASQCINCGYVLKETIPAKGGKGISKKMLLCIGVAAIVALIIVFAIIYKTSIAPSNQYKQAEQALANEEYDDAAEQFEALGDYKDSKDRILECYYEKGKSLMAKKSYSAAIKAFEDSGNYSDATNQIAKAEKAMEEEAAEAAHQAVLEKLKNAYDKCSSSRTSLSSDGMSIMVDSKDKNDFDSYFDVLTIIGALDLPDSLSDEMGQTTAMMGKQKQDCGDYEVTWSYHPDSGLDVIFKVVG